MKATRCSPCRSARRARLPDRGVRRYIRRDDGSGRFGVPGGQRPEGDRRSGCGDARAAVLGRGAEHGGRSGSAGLFRADAVTGAGGQRYGEQRAGCGDLLGDGRRGARPALRATWARSRRTIPSDEHAEGFQRGTPAGSLFLRVILRFAGIRAARAPHTFFSLRLILTFAMGFIIIRPNTQFGAVVLRRKWKICSLRETGIFTRRLCGSPSRSRCRTR